MKSILSIILNLTLFSTISFAAGKDSEGIKSAFTILQKIANSTNNYKVKPGTEKEMLMRLALKEKYSESVEEFNESWVGDKNSAWEADSSSWGSTNVEAAYSYVTTVLDDYLDRSNRKDADKIKFANKMRDANRAFAILRAIKTVRYGVAPLGAVQCGVTFAALMILDTETGDIYQIDMEDSGC